MTAFTLTKHTNLRQLTVAGGYSARTGGDTIANTNGFNFTIDQDTRFGLGAPADALTTSGSFGSINQTAASGGDILVDGTTVWLIPYNTGSGTLAPSLAGVTISGVTCNTIGLYSALNVSPVLTGVAAGWLKVTAVSGTLPSSGSFTSDGFTYTITGAAIRGWIEIVGDDAGTMTLNRLGKLQVRGEYFSLGTTTGVNTTTYQVPNNGKQIWVPRIEVQGATWTITGATWANGKATFTTSATHDMRVGMPVTISGVSPAGYNCTDILIDDTPDITDTSFSVPMVDPGAYVSGGSATAFEQYPCFGYLSAGAVVNENTRRGKGFWNTNATNSLSTPLGVLRFNHDGVNVGTGGYLPPSGRNIRIPNVFFTNCTAAARNQNVLPSASLSTRYDFNTTGAGVIDIDKASICWYLSIAQAYKFKMTNSGTFSGMSLTGIPTTVEMTNVAIGQEAAVAGVAALSTNLNTGATIFKNVIGSQAGTTGTGSAYCWNIANSANVALIDCAGWCYAFRTGGNVKSNIFSVLPNVNMVRFHHIGLTHIMSNCADMFVKDTKYTDTTGIRQTTQVNSVFNIYGPLNSGVIEGLQFVGYRAQNWGNLFNPTGTRTPLKIRNIGTYSNPLVTGEGPFNDKAWARTTTVITVTHVAHGYIVGEPIVVFWTTSTGAISYGVKTVTGTPTVDTFTLTGVNGGDATGVLSYYSRRPIVLLPNSASSNYENISFQRIYYDFGTSTRASSADNSNNNITFESVMCKFDPNRSSLTAHLTLNTKSCMGPSPESQLSPGVYGTTWADGFYCTNQDAKNFTWDRAATTLTLTMDSGSHNLRATNNDTFFVSNSSDTATLANGKWTHTPGTTLGTDSTKLKLTVTDTGATSGTGTLDKLGGLLVCYMNEGTATNTHYEVTAGNPCFNGAGLLSMPKVGDQIVFETPYWVKGYTAFCKMPSDTNTATQLNFLTEYQIDTGTGFGAWKLLRRSTPLSSNINAGSTITVAATESWIQNGYRVVDNLDGVNNDAVVLSGGGTTTLMLNYVNKAVVTNRSITFSQLPDEVIDPTVGFKLRVRITTLIGGAGATNTVGALFVYLHSTQASRQTLLPLDTATVQMSGLVSGSRVKATKVSDGTVLFNGAETGGAISFVTDYIGAVRLDSRKASSAPFYQPYVTIITTISGSTVSATALQQLDE